LIKKGVEWVDVRVPNRELTRREAEELNLRLNKNTASFDYDLLANFEMELLKDVGWADKELESIFQVIDDDIQVSQDKIDKEQEKLDNKFNEANKKILSDYITILCPECGKEITLSKAEILKEGCNDRK